MCTPTAFSNIFLQAAIAGVRISSMYFRKGQMKTSIPASLWVHNTILLRSLCLILETHK